MEGLDACAYIDSHFGSRTAPTLLARAYSPAPAQFNKLGTAVRRRAACGTDHSYDRVGRRPTGRQHADCGDCPLFRASEKGCSNMLKVYGFSKVNAVARGNTRDLRVLWALEEMQLPFELVGMDHPAHDLTTDAYRKLSPFEQVPAIDDDGLILSESAAILIYLAKKAGKLIPSEPAGEAQVVRWCFAAMNSVELPLLSILLIDWAKDAGCSKYRENTVGWANRLLTGLERWLDGREYVATESFTVADILMSHVLAEIKDDALIKPYARVASYRDARMPADGPVRSHRRRALLDLQAIPGVSPRAAHVARHERAGAPGIDRPAPSAQAFSFFISSASTQSARLRLTPRSMLATSRVRMRLP